MRKILYIFFGLLLMVSTVCADEKKENIVSTNVFNFFISTFGAEYERIINPEWGVQGSFRYGSYKIGDVDVSWPGVTVGVRRYIDKEAPSGYFVGASIYANIMSATFRLGTKEDVISAFFIGPMLETGYRWVWDSIVLSPSAIFGYLAGEAKSDKLNLKLSYGGIAYGAGLNLGIAF